MYKYFLLLTVCSLHICFSFAQKKEPIAILIVDGFNNHNWQQTTILTKGILEESGLFKIDVSTVPMDSVEREKWNPEFKKYAAIIQNTNNIFQYHLKWPRHAEVQLENYVQNGGGLYILHGANNSFPHWAAYDKMIGLGWRPASFGYALEIDANKNIVRIPPGEGQATGHGDRFDAVIQKFTNHAINNNYPQQWKTANMEVYNFVRGIAENVTVLSYTYDSTATKRMWPVEWVVNYGKGRVYNSSMGHLWKGDVYPEAYRCIGFQTTMIRVTEWLATGKVNYPLPKNFPGKETVSVRDKDDLPKRKSNNK